MTVNELVEWATKYIPTGQRLTKQQVLNITHAILSHPDLLISREDEQGDKWVIPLVDAIKEMEEDG